MENYLHPEINAIRKLSLPNGLQELMCDITREVLRAQPAQLYEFVKDYLAAMIVTREHLTVASHLHDDICSCLCEFELDVELRKMELSEDDIVKTTKIIQDYLSNNEQMKECNILQKIIKAVNIDDSKIPELQKAIRESFVNNSTRKVRFQENLFTCSSNDEISQAVEHTLRIYRQTGPSEADVNRMAEKIQAAYRGYGITRHVNIPKRDSASPTEDKITDHSIPSIQSAGSPSKEKQIEELFIPNGSDSSKDSMQTYLEEDSVLEEINGNDPENLDEDNDESPHMIKFSSDQDLKAKRNVSFNAEEQELDNYIYQHKKSEEVTHFAQDEPSNEIVEHIEEELIQNENEDNESVIEDCASIYDIHDDEISDSDIFRE